MLWDAGQNKPVNEEDIGPTIWHEAAEIETNQNVLSVITGDIDKNTYIEELLSHVGYLRHIWLEQSINLIRL